MNEKNIEDYCSNFLEINPKLSAKIILNKNIIKLFSEYLNKLLYWSRTHNLISKKLSEESLIENLFDSVVGGSFLSINRPIYDVGSGGGFPAIPLSILYPEWRIVLVESDRKKCSFLRSVKNMLKIHNSNICNSRLEELPNFGKLGFITTKAAFSPANVAVLAQALAQEGSLALWATRKNKESFVSALEAQGLNLVQEYEYQLLEAQQRCVIIFKKP